MEDNQLRWCVKHNQPWDTCPCKDDPVNHPSHYTSHPSGVECIDITRHMNFNVGNAMKYLWRAGLKDRPDFPFDVNKKHIEDLEKARWYINDEIARLQREQQERFPKGDPRRYGAVPDTAGVSTASDRREEGAGRPPGTVSWVPAERCEQEAAGRGPGVAHPAESADGEALERAGRTNPAVRFVEPEDPLRVRYPGKRRHIVLTAAEICSNHDRQAWAEGLIRQLPQHHEGRNSWLLNYGKIEKNAEEKWYQEHIKNRGQYEA